MVNATHYIRKCLAIPGLTRDPTRTKHDGIPAFLKITARKKPNTGFTLLELLVVMVIIAIVVSVAVLAIGDAGRNRRAKYFTQSMVNLMTYTEEYAILQPSTVQLTVSDKQLSFKALHMMAKNNGSLTYAWQTPTSKLFQPRAAPDFTQLQLITQTGPKHTIRFYSNGNISPFILNIRIPRESTYYQIRGNRAGEITWTIQYGDSQS